MAAKIRVGDIAPNFRATTQQGLELQLSAVCENNIVVLYFYPSDHSPHCVQQAVCFRGHLEQFANAGATVLGVSHNTASEHLGFASKYGLAYTLLSDPEGDIHRLYGVPRRFGILPGRVTFVIDRERIVRDLFVAQFQVETHVKRALQAVELLSKSEGGTQQAVG